MIDAMLDSKSNRIMLYGIAISAFIVILAIAILVLFAEQVASVKSEIVTLVGILLGKMGITEGSAVYRSVKVDAPIRQSYAALDVAQQAKESGVEAAVPQGLQHWAPPGRTPLVNNG